MHDIQQKRFSLYLFGSLESLMSPVFPSVEEVVASPSVAMHCPIPGIECESPTVTELSFQCGTKHWSVHPISDQRHLMMYTRWELVR